MTIIQAQPLKTYGIFGPASSTDNEVPVFDGTTGKKIKAGSGLINPSAGRLDLSEVRAKDGEGLKLYDDGGNGIFIADGGNVTIEKDLTVTGVNSIIEDGSAQGQMAFWDSSSEKWVKAETTELVWDDVNKRFGVGTNNPEQPLHVYKAGYDASKIRIVGDQLAGGIKYADMFVNRHGVLRYQGNISAVTYDVNLKLNANKQIQLGSTQDYSLDFDGSKFELISTDIDGAGTNGNVMESLAGTQDVIFPGNIGIGTTSPDTKLQVIGDVKIGDDNTNYLNVATDGELSLHGTAKVKKCFYIDADGIKAPGAKPATFVESGLSGSWEFADAIEANQETISGNVKIPCDADRTIAPILNIGLYANVISPGVTKFQLEYLYAGENDDVTAVAQETLTATATFFSATSNRLTILSFTGIDLPTSTDMVLLWKIKRLSADGDDTVSASVFLKGMFFEYYANKLGAST